LALPYHWQLRFARWKQIFGGMFGGSGEKRPQLCPACGALVGIHANRCHECGTSLRFSLAAWSRGLSEFFGGHAPVTVVVLIVNVLMFGVSMLRSLHSGGSLGLFGGMSGIELYRLGENLPFHRGEWAWWQMISATFVRDGLLYIGLNWWRLILATFLHGGLLHIGLNMMVLMDIAPVVEELFGSARFLFLYVACGIGGSLCSTMLGKYPSVGASGAILGLIGLLLAVTTRRGGASMQAMRSRLISWVVAIFAFGFLVPGIDNWGHFGGLATGFLLGRVFADRQPAPGPERTRAYLLGWLAAAVVIAAFVFMFLQLNNPLPE
jgi:rhomboid protease GluP